MNDANLPTPSEGSPASSLPVAKPDEFLPPIGRWTTIGGLVMLIAFGGAILLSTVLKYKVVVKAPASLRPTGELRLVQAAAEGSIERIEVQPNQRVEAGQVIATVDDSRLQTRKTQLENSLQQSRQQLAELDAQLQALAQQQTAETTRLERTVAAAEADLRLQQRAYQESQIATVANLQEAEAAVNLAQEELNRYRNLSGTGAIAQLQVQEKAAALQVAQARLKRAQAALEPSPAEVEKAGETVAQTQATLEATLAQLRQERTQLEQQRAELQNQLSQDQQEWQQVQTELAQTIITAPSAGTIQALNLRNRSQVVRLGDVLAEIAPSQLPLQIKAQVAAQHIGKVEVGQTVQMRVSACPYPDYGTLKGVVQAISPDALLPQPANSSGSPPAGNPAGAYYTVMIQPDTLTLRGGDQTCPLQSGMEGQAEIISRQETVLRFVLRRARLIAN
jgi:HlyD family secretion protein